VSTELHNYYSDDREFEAKVFYEEKGVFVVRTYENGEEVSVRSFSNESMAEYWADDCVIDYDLRLVAKRGEE
tara:strand:- start:374 stop:589 length:216 start_codon:yes stop_codon:yes gene_type:complete